MALLPRLNVASPEANLGNTPIADSSGKVAWAWMQWFLSMWRVLSLFKVGTGNPNGSVTASPPCVYLNVAGGAGTTLYVKESGANTNTGWVGK